MWLFLFFACLIIHANPLFFGLNKCKYILISFISYLFWGMRILFTVNADHLFSYLWILKRNDQNLPGLLFLYYLLLEVRAYQILSHPLLWCLADLHMWNASQILLSFNVNTVFTQDPTSRRHFNVWDLGKKQHHTVKI